MNYLFALLATLSFASAQTQTVRLALDWVPNTNHTGIYVALANGWYEEAGVDVQILPYSSVSPEVLVANGRAEVGVSSTESVLGAAAAGEPVVSVAAMLSTNTAALAVLEDSGVTRPRELDGKVYAAFGAPWEIPAIAAVLRRDGGDGRFRSAVLNVAGFDALLAGRADFVWIFRGWQGVQAELEGVGLTLFNFSEYGVPDYYTPVLIASPDGVATNAEALRAFLQATARGYIYAAENPAEAAELLLGAAPAGSFPNPELVRRSQALVSSFYIADGRAWGEQRPDYWRGFPELLLNANVFEGASETVRTAVEGGSLYTNALLPE